MKQIISHLYTDNSGNWVIQSNDEHSMGVAKLASQFAGEFGMSEYGKVLGLLHDKGKETDAFQQYIKKESGYVPDIKICGKHQHAYVGGILAQKYYGKFSRNIFVNQIVSHHTGLHDSDEIKGIVDQEIPSEVNIYHKKEKLNRSGLNVQANDFHHLARMLFSCLVDADYLDTEAFLDKESSALRQNKDALNDLLPLLENIIDGYSNLNPARKARRNIFLTDEQWENERKALVNRLSVWLKLLRENDTAEQMRDKAKETAENAENLLNHNLKNALARTRELESAYRTIAFFYKNTESDKVKNVTIVNATMEQLQDLDNTIFADHISNELKQNFDRLDLRRNYSLLVVPGYIGSNAILDKWSKMAYENKAFLVTDFQDLETPDDVVDIFFNANHTSGDVFKSNTIMTCNWLLGRQREESVGEEENLYIPPSSSLAGKIYNTLMSQVVAGKKFGGLNEVESVRFDLRKSEISELERMGLVPMVNEYSKVMAFSAKTLFNGDNLGLQTYSVVRVFDYITKVLIDFLNRRAFENWTTRTEADLRGQVVKFLDSVMGPNKLIERFKVMKIEQDPNQKDRVLLDIHITPYFPAKSFVIQLAGHKGDNPEDAIWESEYHQE